MTSILVDDPIKAFKFYTEILGFKKLIFSPESNLAVISAPERINGTAILLEPADKEEELNYQRSLYVNIIPAIVFGSKNLESDYKKLKGLGVKFKNEPTETEWGYVTLFDDTCGNYIQIHQDLKKN